MNAILLKVKPQEKGSMIRVTKFYSPLLSLKQPPRSIGSRKINTMSLASIFKKDPLVQMLSGKSATKRKKKSTGKSSGGLTASEKRIVSAVSKRVKTTKRKKRY